MGLGVALMVLTAGGSAFGQSGTDALFFAHSGVDKLPVMLMLAGGLLFGTSIVFTALLGVVGRQRLFLVVPVVSAAVLLIERAIVAAAPSWIYPLLWLSASVVVMLQWLFTWGLLGIVVDTRQAKRLFPLFGAGAILGVVVGGLLTGPLASLIGAENLLFVWGTALVAASSVGRVLVGSYRAKVVRARRSRRAKARPLEEMQQGFRFVRGSSVMRWMSLSAILFSVLFFSLYLPFSRAAADRFIGADALAGFFGLFSAVTTAAALLASLFLTNRLIARFGVPSMLMGLALIYLAGFGVLIVVGTFATIVAVRFVQMLWSQAVANPAWEAVVNIVPPVRRDQTRAFLNGGPTQLGTVLAGLIQLIGLRRLSPLQLYAIGLGTAALTTYATWNVRRSYATALIDALRQGRPQVFSTLTDEAPFTDRQVDATAVSALVEGASGSDVRVRRAAVEILGDLRSDEASAALLTAVHDLDAMVRATALRSLAHTRAETALPVASLALDDPEAEVRLAAIRAIDILGNASTDGRDPIRRRLVDPDPSVRSAAASVILRRSSSEEALAAVQSMFATDDPATRSIALEALEGSELPETFGLAALGLHDPSSRVRAAAARAVPASDPGRAIPPLVGALADENGGVRDAAALVLGRIGPAAVEPVMAALFDPALAPGALLALEQLPAASTQDVVRGYAREEAARAVADFDVSCAMNPDGDDRERLLRDSLIERARRQAVNALRAAALLGERKSMRFAIDNLSSRDPMQVANALEAIESMGEHTVVRPLLQLWETADPDMLPRVVWLPRLLHDPDPWIRGCATLLRGPTTEGDPMTDDLAIISQIERVLFLRKVPLFVELPPQDLERVAAIAEERAFVDGETIAGEGEPGDDLHIVVEGEVRVMRAGSARAPEVELARRVSGDVVGEMALITQEPRMASLVASGDVRTLQVGRKDFEGVLRERPDTAIAVIRVLSRRLVESAGIRAD